MRVQTAVGRRPRAYVRVSGPQAEDYLQRMVSNDVAQLGDGDACEALLLTPKARVIAPLRVLRRAPDDFLLLTEPELGEVVREHLTRFRFAARAEIEPEEHTSLLVFGHRSGDILAIPTSDYGTPAWEVLDPEEAVAGDELPAEELERMRIVARTPVYGREIDDRVLPAEAGLVERAVSLTKGCYPGQEPVARLHYRGHANRSLRLLEIDTEEPPAPDAEIFHGEKSVGRITSAVAADGRVLALGYVRVEVPDDAGLVVGGARARPLH